jgi:hypothetical protein
MFCFLKVKRCRKLVESPTASLGYFSQFVWGKEIVLLRCLAVCCDFLEGNPNFEQALIIYVSSIQTSGLVTTTAPWYHNI